MVYDIGRGRRFPVNPKKKLLIVRHSALNGDFDLEKIVRECGELQPHIEREVSVCLEGDLTQVRGTGEIILTHQTLFSPSEARYERLRADGIAVPLDGVLQKIADYNATHPNQRVVICLELKIPTSEQTISTAVKELKHYGLLDDVFFDSYFGPRLGQAKRTSFMQLGYTLPCTLHLLAKLGPVNINLPGAPRHCYDIVTASLPSAFGEPTDHMIYGAVKSLEEIKRLAANNLVVGLYDRRKDGSVTRMARASIGNKIEFRHPYLGN